LHQAEKRRVCEGGGVEIPEAESPSDAGNLAEIPTKEKTVVGKKLAVKSGKTRKALPGRLRKKLANEKKKAAPKT
jgi:hypothetical protein